MGLYDRDYYRRQPPPGGFQLGQHMMVTNIVIITAAFYVLNLFIGRDDWLMRTLAVDPSVLGKPWLWWKFITYGFAHEPRSLSHIFWNMFGLWIFGRDVEGLYGRKEFLRIYLVSLAVGSLVWAARETLLAQAATPHGILLGASGAVTAIILLFVFHFPNRIILLMFVLPVPAWVLGLLIIGGDLWMTISAPVRGTGPAVAFDVHLVGAAFAICYYRFGWNLGRWSPRLGVGNLLSKLKPRPRLKIHDPDEYYRRQDEEADRILEKVSRQGIDSLTARERRILEDYSRRLRERRR